MSPGQISRSSSSSSPRSRSRHHVTAASSRAIPSRAKRSFPGRSATPLLAGSASVCRLVTAPYIRSGRTGPWAADPRERRYNAAPRGTCEGDRVVNGPVDPAAETRRTEVPDGVPGANGAAPPPAGPGSAPPGRGRGPLVAATLALAVAIVASAAFFATRPTPTASVAPSPTPSEIAVTTPSPSPVASTTPSPTPTATPEPSPTPPSTSGYLADRADLVARAALAQQGVQPYKAAVDDLMAWAQGARGSKPHPVRSLRIDGTEGPFVDDTATAYGLALAYVVSGDEQYAQASARFIDAWVDTMTRTRLTCANDGACQTSLIIGRTAPGFVFAADLLSESPSFDAAAQARLKRWLHDLILPTASRLTNNWGDTGTFTRVAITAYLGD